MGLTVHFDLSTRKRNVRPLIEQMRQIALDLPFEEVLDIVHLKGDECIFNRADENDENGWMKIQRMQYVKCPWNSNKSFGIDAKEIVGFTILVGPGCEPIEIGLATYPKTVEVTYVPWKDKKFNRKYSDGSDQFNWNKFDNWCYKNKKGNLNPMVGSTKSIPTKISGWQGRGFCKTEYASDPACGGPPNFIRCHISVVTFLERIQKLEGVKLNIRDEGHYGPHKIDNVEHPGKYNVKALIEEVTSWNEMLAALAGVFKDAYAGEVESPITKFSNFENLEFRGSQDEDIKPFLNSLKQFVGAEDEE